MSTAAGWENSKFSTFMVRLRVSPFAALSYRFLEPSTAQTLGTVADCDLNDVQSAVESANIAQKSYYSSTTAAQRGSLLRKWHDLVIENVEDRKYSLGFFSHRMSLTCKPSGQNPLSREWQDHQRG